VGVADVCSRIQLLGGLFTVIAIAMIQVPMKYSRGLEYATDGIHQGFLKVMSDLFLLIMPGIGVQLSLF
jgi:hypothetical protein